MVQSHCFCPFSQGGMLNANNTLKELNLSNCELQPEGLEEVIKSIQVNTKLETLVLSLKIIDNKRSSCLGKNYIYTIVYSIFI